MKLSTKPRFDYISIGLCVALLLALALRLYGIRWGLPDASHPLYSYHPDEALHLFWADWLAHGRIVPKHFMYGGTLYFALLNAISHVAEVIQPILGEKELLPATILLGRYIQVALAFGTVVVVYLTGKAFFDRRTGILAALFLAVAPAHIIMAQQLRPDEGGAFLVALIVYLSARMLRAEIALTRYCAYSGLILGLATSLRFPLIVFVAMPVFAVFLAAPGKSWRSRIDGVLLKHLAILCGFIVASYLIANPQIFAHFEVFRAGLEVQWRYQSGPFPDAVDMGPGIYQYGWSMLRQALGYALYLLAVGGFVLALWRRTAADMILIAGLVLYLTLTSFASWVVVRYTLPVMPLLVLVAARFADTVLCEARPGRALGCVVLAAALSWTIASDVAYLRLAGGKNVRDIASNWLAANVPKGASLVSVKTYAEDDFFNPVIPRDISSTVFFLRQGADVREIFGGKNKYDYFVLHEYIYRNMERLGDRHPLSEVYDLGRALAKSRYSLLKEFKLPTEFLGVDFSTSFSSNDFTLVNPGIRIYRYDG